MSGFIEDQERKLAAMQAAADLAEQRRQQLQAQADLVSAQKLERDQAEADRKVEADRQEEATALRDCETARSLYENSPFKALLSRLAAIKQKMESIRNYSTGFSIQAYGPEFKQKPSGLSNSSFVIEAWRKEKHISLIDRIAITPEPGPFNEKSVGFYLEFHADGAVIGHGKGKPIVTSISEVEQNPALAEDILGHLYAHPKTLRVFYSPPSSSGGERGSSNWGPNDG